MNDDERKAKNLAAYIYGQLEAGAFDPFDDVAQTLHARRNVSQKNQLAWRNWLIVNGEQLLRWLDTYRVKDANYVRELIEAREDARMAKVRYAKACMDICALRRALKNIVDLDSDSHPGLSTWIESRDRAHNEAKAIVYANAEERDGL